MPKFKHKQGDAIKIALYGGTFDPPHLGHIAVIEAALRELNIERLIVVPTYINPFKSQVHVPTKLRLSWMKKVCDPYTNVEVWDFEIANNRPTPSIETVKALQLRYNLNEKPYLIIGADNALLLSKWHHYDVLKDLVEFVVASRDHIEVDKAYRRLTVDVPINSTSLRETIDKKWLPQVLQEEISTYFKEHTCKKD